jgi:hypothetical protein
LQSVFGSECVPAREPLRPQELRAGEVLLYPILLPDRIELLYAVGGADAGLQAPAAEPERQPHGRFATCRADGDLDELWRGRGLARPRPPAL